MKVEITRFIANWCVFLYFLVLCFERVMSLVRSIKDEKVALFSNGFNRTVYTLVIVSLLGFVIMLFACDFNFLKSLFTLDKVAHDAVNIKLLAATVGFVLISGMMHTEYTVPGIQFASYGILIVGLILIAAGSGYSGNAALLSWMSLAYVVAFSMAIPVVYESKIANAALFHIVETITALVLIAVFTYMFYQIYTGAAVNLFMVWPLALVVVLDALVLALRWKESVNGFVLVSLIASFVLWLAGKIASLIVNR